MNLLSECECFQTHHSLKKLYHKAESAKLQLYLNPISLKRKALNLKFSNIPDKQYSSLQLRLANDFVRLF